MKKFLWIVLLSGIAISGGDAAWAQAITPEMIDRVKLSVIELCRGGTIEGSANSVDIIGEGGVTVVVLKRLAELGVNGRVEFSQSEWKGIQAVIPEQWDQAAYNKCVNPNMRLFLDKLEQSNKDRIGDVKIYNENSSTLCGDSHVRVVVYKRSARLAKPEVLLIGGNLAKPELKLRVGESTMTASNCSITLAQTGFDRDFYALLKFESSTR